MTALRVCFAPTGNISDGTVSAGVKQFARPQNYAYGLLLRHEGSGNWYEFDIASNGEWIFDKIVNLTRSHIVDWRESSAIRTSLYATNTLKVQMAGSQFTFYINDIMVGQASDTTFANGRVGVANAGPSPLEVVFTNYLVTIPNN